tara:strand:+ start:15494 stop:17419 length:1926 start_codon:yes stop_codon:yes gene_type:complete
VPDNKGSLFTRLTKLFRSGPVVRRKVRDYTQPGASSALEVFRKAHSDVYNSTLSAYGAFDRMSRYSDFSEMEATPEIGSALDIYSEECVSSDEKGKVLHVYSENTRVQEILEELFYDILNVDFNLVMWARNLCKYGDFFLFNDISPEYGVINAYPISISEIEREEGFDADDPMAVRFRWITQGNQVLENWQISHFRLLGNDAFLPYGSSVLESARRIWRQLILMEDAMLVYRVIRAPERRVFYIDVGNVAPEEIENYMQQAQSSLKKQPVIDKTSGQVDYRYNPYSVDEDYFLPVRGGESGTKIDTLAGGSNAAAIEDVQYIQKKLFAALKIPRAYLGYDEDVGSKATLAQEDIRFSRSIQKIQKTLIAELNKVAMIHLYCHGFEGDQLSDFNLRLTNPSSIAQQQKLELIRSQFEIAGTAPEGVVDREWIRRNILGLTSEEISGIKDGRISDKVEDAEVEAGAEAASTEGGGDAAADEGGEEDLFSGDKPEGDLLTALPGVGDNLDEDDEDPEDFMLNLSMDDENAPEKAQTKMNAFGGPIKASRKVRNGPDSTHMPDFEKIVSVGKRARGQDSMNKPFDNDFIMNPLPEQNIQPVRPRLTSDLQRMMTSMDNIINIKRKSLLSEILSEDNNGEDQNGEA